MLKLLPANSERGKKVSRKKEEDDTHRPSGRHSELHLAALVSLGAG